MYKYCVLRYSNSAIPDMILYGLLELNEINGPTPSILKNALEKTS